MKRQIMLLSACTVALLSACSSNTRIANEVYAPAAKNELRAPATPLVTIDPYTSAWSFADHLNEESVRHWTGRNFPLLGSLRVDGGDAGYRYGGFRLMGGDLHIRAAGGRMDRRRLRDKRLENRQGGIRDRR